MTTERTFRKPDDVVRDALLAELDGLLAECTEEQQARFLVIFPGGLESLTDNQIQNAILLCQRTIRKNLKEPT